jgi:hypothetical protein
MKAVRLWALFGIALLIRAGSNANVIGWYNSSAAQVRVTITVTIDIVAADNYYLNGEGHLEGEFLEREDEWSFDVDVGAFCELSPLDAQWLYDSTAYYGYWGPDGIPANSVMRVEITDVIS